MFQYMGSFPVAGPDQASRTECMRTQLQQMRVSSVSVSVSVSVCVIVDTHSPHAYPCFNSFISWRTCFSDKNVPRFFHLPFNFAVIFAFIPTFFFIILFIVITTKVLTEDLVPLFFVLRFFKSYHGRCWGVLTKVGLLVILLWSLILARCIPF
jgi:hypothetical protein